jgi:hypothetical protein
LVIASLRQRPLLFYTPAPHHKNNGAGRFYHLVLVFLALLDYLVYSCPNASPKQNLRVGHRSKARRIPGTADIMSFVDNH